MAIRDLRYAATLLKQGFTVSEIKSLINMNQTETETQDNQSEETDNQSEETETETETQDNQAEETKTVKKENPLHRAEKNHSKPDLIAELSKIL